MLKRWGISFNHAHDYFHLRHLWVLLPSLPLYLWNAKTLEAIGTSLGKVLVVDFKALEAPIKRVARVLVELDIHEGLQESIDIEWQGHTIRQNIDYLGIPFRCTLYKQTGHLQNQCSGRVAKDLSEESMLDLSTRLDSPCDHSTASLSDFSEVVDSTALNTTTGKLKLFCPSLYFSLTAWERDLIDNSPTMVYFAPSTHSSNPPLPKQSQPLTSSSVAPHPSPEPHTLLSPILSPTTHMDESPLSPRAIYSQMDEATRDCTPTLDTLPSQKESSTGQVGESAEPLRDNVVGHR